MADAKHTSGPWEVAHAGSGKAGGMFEITEYYVRLPGADFSLAADIVDADMKPSEANARLIAAAPELYEALQLAQDFLEHSTEFRIGNPGFEQCHAKVSAAIAKASA